jgi:sugar O-acyltransferase (sialic acid O-acetyltransferase NeuD family)
VTANRRCVILGGGGHARVVIDSLLEMGAGLPYGILDSDRSRWGQELYGVPFLGGDDLLPKLAQEGVEAFVVGLGGTGDNQPRRRLFEWGLSCGLEPLTVIHPSAICSRWSEIGRGDAILPGAVVNAGAKLGENVIVNSGAVVEHDCVVGDHAHIATGAQLASAVAVGPGAHIGAGATVRQCITIGGGAIVGAGAVVVRDVAAHAIVAGVPARLLSET